MKTLGNRKQKESCFSVINFELGYLLIGFVIFIIIGFLSVYLSLFFFPLVIVNFSCLLLQKRRDTWCPGNLAKGTHGEVKLYFF